MFDDINIRAITRGEDTYIHALDFARHLVYVSIDMQNMPVAEDEQTKAMDYAAIATLRMVANLLLKAEDVEYMRNHLDTFEDFLSLAGIDTDKDI